MTHKAVGIETGTIYATGTHQQCVRAVNERVSNIDGRQNERIEHSEAIRVMREDEYIRTEDEQLEAIEEKMRQTKEKKHIQLEIKKAALAEERERKRIAAEQEAAKRAESRKRLPPDAWSSAEEAFVKTNIDMPTKELTAKLAERFGKIVTEKAVTRRKAKLRELYGIPARPKKPWTKEEDDYIVQHYNRMSAEKIGFEIKRTRAAVEARVILLKRGGEFDRGQRYDKEQDYWRVSKSEGSDGVHESGEHQDMGVVVMAEKMDTTQIIKPDDMPDESNRSAVKIGKVVPYDSVKVDKHLAICKQLNQTYQEKNADYGDSFSETYQKLGIISAVTRISDKTNRLISLAGKPEAERMVKDETLRDTLIDLAGYAVLILLEMESAEKCECTSQELCEYCVSGVCGNETIYDEMDRGFMAHVRDGILNIGVATANFHEHSEMRINYCPMCGRKLEEPTC